jgi:hypothetical protein
MLMMMMMMRKIEKRHKRKGEVCEKKVAVVMMYD